MRIGLWLLIISLLIVPSLTQEESESSDNYNVDYSEEETDDGVVRVGDKAKTHIIIEGCSEEAEYYAHEIEAEERLIRYTIVLGFSCLAVTYLCGYYLERFHIGWFPEAGAGIIVGIVAGLILHAFHSSEKVTEIVQFDPEIFFVLLLPPIIFESGYNMKRQAFFRNWDGIAMYAFIGTTISTFIVGGIVYFAGKWGICHALPGLASLVFGALISATDPVTVLAVFQKLHADIDLYSLVFGESVLNDAVAIVMYRTLLIFKCEEVSVATIFIALGKFVMIFAVSTIIGWAYGLVCAFIFKNAGMWCDREYEFLELTILCCFPYLAFMTAEGLHLSGIVAILFCGIAMAHYAYNNLSAKSAETSRIIFKVLASLAETFVFVYLGLAMFTFPQSWSRILLLIVSILACLFARLFNIYPLTFLVNLWRKPEKKPGKIDHRFQFIMWFSGLRGAVAFVLAVVGYGHQDFGEASRDILTTTLLIAIFTVFIMGGSIGYLMDKFDVKEKSTVEEKAAYAGQMVGLMARGKSEPTDPRTSKFIGWDKKYLKPIFERPAEEGDTHRENELTRHQRQATVEEVYTAGDDDDKSEEIEFDPKH